MAHLVAPSLLSANFLNLEKDIGMLNQSEADWFHLDVMDGLFVPNISFGFAIIEKIRQATHKILDVHLMIVEPERYLERFKRAGADIISIHQEACKNPIEAIKTIKNLNAKAGIVINPATPVSTLSAVINHIDMVLLMSVNPGFGGQSFMPGTFGKIAEIRQMIKSRQLNVMVEVDGGIDLNNAPKLVQSGVDILVAGNTIFSSPDPVQTIHQLKTIC
ncbi:MAG: ribulose-phosphate 3-epimerase [Bacteroidales bacterium]|nr:ribulose-phosphate 3-epimerase [Bacteroidales bacterium]